ncbi:MAG: hypothetical protein KKB50_18515 [Planctomycetes bacterium]|nr:hypothetical protein [Planctomycetota bacterium]
MEAPNAASDQLFDEAETIICDLACRRCGYNLRGLHRDGRCPECGTNVGLSTHGDLLRFADPDWVENLARGLNLILWGILANIVFGTMGGIAHRFIAPAVGVMLGFVGSLVAFYGAWLLTQPDPSGIDEDRYVTARKFIRFALLIGLLYSIGAVIVAGLNLPTLLRIILFALAGLAGLVGLAGEFAKLLYLQRLALRVPDQRAADRARFLRWAWTICYGAIIVVGGLFGFMTAVAPTGGPSGGLAAGIAVLGCFMAVLGIAALVFLLLYVRLMYNLRQVFRQQAQEARSTWAAASAGNEPASQPPSIPGIQE